MPPRAIPHSISRSPPPDVSPLDALPLTAIELHGEARPCNPNLQLFSSTPFADSEAKTMVLGAHGLVDATAKRQMASSRWPRHGRGADEAEHAASSAMLLLQTVMASPTLAGRCPFVCAPHCAAPMKQDVRN